MSYLAQRSKVLVKELRSRLDDLDGQDPTRDAVDAIISIAERLRLVASPRGTTIGWLMALLHYRHTLSGPMTAIDPAETHCCDSSSSARACRSTSSERRPETRRTVAGSSRTPRVLWTPTPSPTSCTASSTCPCEQAVDKRRSVHLTC